MGARDIKRGVGRGKVYPHEAAAGLDRWARRLVQPPAAILGHLRLTPADVVLELGCGPGYFSPEAASRVPAGRLVLFDLQREMLDLARRKLAGEGIANARAAQGDARALPFREGAFDAVFLVTVLGEVGDPAACLREVRRVLRPGGRVALSETRGDPDFIPRARLRALVEHADLAHEGTHGLGWNYTLTARKPG